MWLVISILALCASGQTSGATFAERVKSVCEIQTNAESVLCTGVGGEGNGKTLLANLKRDHARLYKKHRYITDDVLYGIREHWTIAVKRGPRIVGDCEDVAMYMMDRTLSHYPNSSVDSKVFLLVVQTIKGETGANHVAFGLYHEGKWHVSDNQHSKGVRVMNNLDEEYQVYKIIRVSDFRS